MEVIIMYVFLLSGHWVEYTYGDDPMIYEQITTLDECADQAELLMVRRGDVTSWVCYQGGSPGHLVTPPYKWPRSIWSVSPECDSYCVRERMKEEEANAERNRQQSLEPDG
jgi:hypothetical protein